MEGVKVSVTSLGTQGLTVSQQGLGCMGMTASYGAFNRLAQEDESQRTIATALELGINFFDTAWIYQSFSVDGGPNVTNEELLGRAIRIHGRDKFVIATKFGVVVPPDGQPHRICGKEITIRSQLADSLSRLGTDYIDLYYQHRVDPETPIEETMAVLKELVKEGKIKYVGLSECTAEELSRACSIFPVSAIQMEWSLQSRSAEKMGVIETARELGVGIVAYSPLGRGMLTGTILSREHLDVGDSRRELHPRFNSDNFQANIEAKKAFFTIAQDKYFCSPAQLALAWVHAQGMDVVSIPGAKTVKHLQENVEAIQVSRRLTSEDILEVGRMVSEASGERYAAHLRSYFETRL